jgi:hypothetical protein
MTEKEFANQGPANAGQPAGAPRSTRELNTAEPIKDQLGDTVSNVTQQATEKVGQLADQAKQTVTEQVATQKDKASEALTSVAQALRQTGDQLRSNDQGAIGQYAGQAADQIERLSGFLRDRDVNDILYEAEQFARRQPAVFLGGAFVLGLLGARFLKSSQQNAQSANRYPYPAPRSYQPTRPMQGRSYGPNYNPANRQQPRNAYPQNQASYDVNRRSDFSGATREVGGSTSGMGGGNQFASPNRGMGGTNAVGGNERGMGGAGGQVGGSASNMGAGQPFGSSGDREDT